MENAHVTDSRAVRITEEVFSSATHGIGAAFAIAGLVIGLVTLTGRPAFTVSFILYASCLILLLLSSGLYHALLFTRASRVFQIFDHTGIFLLIAGSFTPFIVMLYGGWLQADLLALVWLLAAAG